MCSLPFYDGILFFHNRERTRALGREREREKTCRRRHCGRIGYEGRRRRFFFKTPTSSSRVEGGKIGAPWKRIQNSVQDSLLLRITFENVPKRRNELAVESVEGVVRVHVEGVDGEVVCGEVQRLEDLRQREVVSVA